MTRSLSVLILLLFLLTSPLPAGESVIAKYGGEFMSIGVGARPLGMGGAYVAVARDVATAYWNPAGLAGMTYPQIIGMYAQQFDRILNYNYLGIAIPFHKDATFAISGMRLGADDIPFTVLPDEALEIGEVFTNESGQTIRNVPYVDHYFGAAQYAFYVSYARRKNKTLYYGANIKMIYHGIGDNSAWGIGFDVGALWNPFDRIRLGANLQDGTTTMLAWDTGRREFILPTLKTGIAYMLPISFLKGQLLPACDIDWRFEGREFASQLSVGTVSMDFHFGVEYNLKNIIALRIGSDLGKFTAGAGFRLPRLNVDYAFLSHADLGDTHRISLQLTLEEKRFQRL